MTQEIEIIIDEPIVLEMGAQRALPDSVVIDENYVHTDNNYTDVEKDKVANALTSETDPTVPAHVKSITETDISNWNTPSHSHANKTELDSITATKIAEWNAALQAEDLAGLASEAYVDTKVAGIVDTAPETLNTLNELAAALGDDPNFATTVATQLGQKANTADLGTAAAQNSTAFATAAQGIKADSALQSETDPTVPAHVKAITEADIDSWNNTAPPSASITLEGKNIIPPVSEFSFTGGVLHTADYQSLNASLVGKRVYWGADTISFNDGQLVFYNNSDTVLLSLQIRGVQIVPAGAVKFKFINVLDPYVAYANKEEAYSAANLFLFFGFMASKVYSVSSGYIQPGQTATILTNKKYLGISTTVAYNVTQPVAGLFFQVLPGIDAFDLAVTNTTSAALAIPTDTKFVISLIK